MFQVLLPLNEVDFQGATFNIYSTVNQYDHVLFFKIN